MRFLLTDGKEKGSSPLRSSRLTGESISLLKLIQRTSRALADVVWSWTSSSFSTNPDRLRSSGHQCCDSAVDHHTGP